MLYYDITTALSATDTLTHFTKLHSVQIKDFINANVNVEGTTIDAMSLTADNFISKFDIDCSEFDPDSCLICAKHYTSNNDACAYILANGIQSLKYVLSSDSPLKKFLVDNGINIYLDTNQMTYGDQTFDISPRKYGVPSDSLAKVSRKIHSDHQTTSFLYIENVKKYGSSIWRSPEFLLDIDNLIPRLNLSKKWEQSCRSYMIKYAMPIYAYKSYTFSDFKSDDMDSNKLYTALIDNALQVASNCSDTGIIAYMKDNDIISKQNILSICEISHDCKIIDELNIS